MSMAAQSSKLAARFTAPDESGAGASDALAGETGNGRGAPDPSGPYVSTNHRSNASAAASPAKDPSSTDGLSSAP